LTSVIAIEVDCIFEVIGGGELHAAELARPITDHVLDTLITSLDDAQRVQQLLTEKLRPTAIISERRECTQDVVFAKISSEVAFQAPESGQHLSGHAIFFLNARE